MLQTSLTPAYPAFLAADLPLHFETAAVARHTALRAVLGYSALHYEPKAATPVAPKPKAARAKAKSEPLGAEAFWRMAGRALRAIGAEYGDRWAIKAPHGETVLATVPSKLRSFKTERGVTIRYRADHRLPAARFWPDGKLPDGLIISADPPRETQAREWGDRRDGDASNGGYATWFMAWAKRNNLPAEAA